MSAIDAMDVADLRRKLVEVRHKNDSLEVVLKAREEAYDEVFAKMCTHRENLLRCCKALVRHEVISASRAREVRAQSLSP